ncbi:hypothetical protein B1987_14905 [Mycobacterium kansasii]|nr:hypothetical protein B1987_14905 [Mycobacterium kansasii]
MTGARVLSEFYGSVSVVEREVLPDRAEQRKGVSSNLPLRSRLRQIGAGVTLTCKCGWSNTRSPSPGWRAT